MAWTQFELPSGVNPWSFNDAEATQRPEMLGRQGGLPDYATSMGSLVHVVQGVCKGCLPGELLKMEYRILSGDAERSSEGQQAAAKGAVHCLGQLPRDTPLAPPPAALAKQLRADQRMFLTRLHKAEAESRPIEVACRGRAILRFTSVVVGELARLQPELSWKTVLSHLSPANRERLAELDCASLGRVLNDWGTVVQLSPFFANAAWVTQTATVQWRLLDGSTWEMTLPLGHWRVAPRHEALRVGATVRVRYQHDFVDCRQLGTVLSVQGEMATVRFPTALCWRGSLTQLVLAEAGVGDPSETGVLEVRLHIRYSLRGSVLASEMGSGKTAVIIALLASTPAKASLVVVPSELHGQWMGEFEQWLGGSFLKSRLKAGGVTVWAPNNVQRYKEGVHQAASNSVVLLPDKLFKSKGYPQEAECPEGLFHPRRMQWHRLVLDEVHLVSQAGREVQRELLALRADSVHGVSATPQQGSGNVGAAMLLRLMGATPFPYGVVDDSNVEATKTAQAFFQEFAMTAPSPCSTRVARREVRVQLSAAERVLYDSAVGRGVGGRELLDLCSCFVRSETSAMREIGVLLKTLRSERDQESARARAEADFARQLACALERSELAPRAQRRLADRRQRCHDLKTSSQWQRGRAVVDGFFSSPAGPATAPGARGVKSSQLLDICGPLGLLDMARSAEGELKDLFKEAFEEQLSHQSSNYEKLGQTILQLEFLEQSAGELDEACTLCLEDLSAEPACSFKCGHKLHQSCYHELVKRSSRCPTCRQQWQRNDVFSLSVEGDEFQKYGTKVKCIVEFLQQLQLERPTAKVLLFAQYEALRKKLLAAFAEFKLPCVTMQGSAEAQSSIQRSWQSGDATGPRVMLLSMEKHAAGLHLTAADVVVFAHPPLTANAAEAEQLEAQAVGRACRVGQRSEEVSVWRFVTDDSVEAALAAQNPYESLQERASKRARR